MVLDVQESAYRLVKAALGDNWCDYETVMGLGTGYANGSPDEVWVRGNWNNRDRYDRESDKWILIDDMPSRLATALERIGVTLEWYDQTEECCECFKLIETDPTHYGWRPEYVSDGNGHTCHECVNKYPEDYLEEYLDNSDRAIAWTDTATLERLGFTLWTGVPEGSESGRYESGWHPGQDASPSTIMDEIHEHDSDLQVVFYLDETSQFYIGFSAWTRPTPED